MDIEKELHKIMKYFEDIIIQSDGPVMMVNINALRKANEYLRSYKNLVCAKDKDASNHVSNRRQLKDLYNVRYQMKAEEITGRSHNDDGKPIHPRWDVKANSLLKLDYEEHGFRSMQRYIELFFADDVESVASFTKKVNKAGYGYTIFHSMLPRLTMFSKEPRIPCKHCGMRDGHKSTCPQYKKIIEKSMEQINNEVAIKKELADVSVIELFNESISSRRALCRK